MKSDINSIENSVDPDQLTSEEDCPRSLFVEVVNLLLELQKSTKYVDYLW